MMWSNLWEVNALTIRKPSKISSCYSRTHGYSFTLGCSAAKDLISLPFRLKWSTFVLEAGYTVSHPGYLQTRRSCCRTSKGFAPHSLVPVQWPRSVNQASTDYKGVIFAIIRTWNWGTPSTQYEHAGNAARKKCKWQLIRYPLQSRSWLSGKDWCYSGILIIHGKYQWRKCRCFRSVRQAREVERPSWGLEVLGRRSGSD